MLRLYEAGTFFTHPGQAGPGNSQNNIFHINTSYRDEKRLDLLHFSLEDVLVCLIFSRSSQLELLQKRSSQGFGAY